MLRSRSAGSVDERSQTEIACAFDVERQIAEEFAVRAELKRLFDRALMKIMRRVVAGDGDAIIRELRVVELIDFASRAAAIASIRKIFCKFSNLFCFQSGSRFVLTNPEFLRVLHSIS